MVRFLMFAVLVGLVGCQQGGGSGNDRLSPKERAAWEKFRKDNPDAHILVGYLTEFQPPWRICIYDYTFYGHRWGEKFDFWTTAEKDQANVYAKERAQDKGVAAVAFVDLVSKGDPQVVWWYTMEGTQVKRINKAPKKDLEASLESYLRVVQSNAELMKP